MDSIFVDAAFALLFVGALLGFALGRVVHDRWSILGWLWFGLTATFFTVRLFSFWFVGGPL